jgi:hypothetical protein
MAPTDRPGEVCRGGRSSSTCRRRIGFVVDGWPVVLDVDGPLAVLKSGWSVLVHGVADEVRDGDELARRRALPLEPWAGGPRDHWIRIGVVQITGRRLAERGRYAHPPA